MSRSSRFTLLMNMLLTSRTFYLNVLVASVISALIVGINLPSLPIFTGNYPTNPAYTDAHWYRELAHGNIDHVPRPFSSRILLPVTVYIVTATGYLSTDQAFFAIGILALVILALVVTSFTASLTSYPILPIFFLFTPFLIKLSAAYYLADLFHAAVVALFFWLLRDRLWITSLTLFLLFLARESTILLGFSLIVVALSRKQISLAVTSGLVCFAGIASVLAIGTAGLPNMHALGILYLPLKVVFNFAWNILGFELYTNTFSNCIPLWTVKLPEMLPLGKIHTVGLCQVDLMRPQHTVLNLLALFGTAPTLVLVAVVRERGQNLLTNYPLSCSVALLYGAIAFLLGTTLGSPNWRLMGYGWPAFWIAMPLILARCYFLTARQFVLLVSCYLIASWVPAILRTISSARVYDLPLFLGGVTVLILAHYLSFRTVRHAPTHVNASNAAQNN